jgi:hypothetical protein
MAKLSKAGAARCIGVTRATLYRYINQGRISVDPEGNIDTAELLRAGFQLYTDGVSGDVSARHDETPAETVELARLTERLSAVERERDLLRQDLADAKQEKAKLLDLLTSQQRLLEAGQKPSWWARLWRRG